MARYLHGWSSREGHLPDIRGAAARRSEIDPPSVSRPAWYDLGRCLMRELPRQPAPLGVDHKDVSIAVRSRVERDLLSVRRPTRRSTHGIEMRELDEIGAITAAHPNLIASTTG